MYLISGALFSRPLFSCRDNGEYRWVALGDPADPMVHCNLRPTRCVKVARHSVTSGCWKLTERQLVLEMVVMKKRRRELMSIGLPFTALGRKVGTAANHG